MAPLDRKRRASSTDTEAATIQESIGSAAVQEAMEEASQLMLLSLSSQVRIESIPSDAGGFTEPMPVTNTQATKFEAMPKRPQKFQKTTHGSKAQPPG